MSRSITQHTAITGPNLDPANDVEEIVDVNDFTDAPTGTNKKVLLKEKLSRAWGFFRNIANTFDSILTNTNTAIRTYTFQDRSGTVADLFKHLTTGSTNNRYHVGAPYGITPGNITSTINSLRAYPVVIDSIVTIDRIAVQIVTGTSGKMRVGIYADNGSGMPGALVVDSGEFTITTPAVLQANINVTLSPGLYWFAFLADTANSCAGFTAASQMLPFLGFANTAFNVSMGSIAFVAQAYGPLPDPFTAGAAIAASATPMVAIRIA